MKTSFEELEKCIDVRAPRTPTLFRILILFEDEQASDRAMRLHDHLFQNVKDYCRLEKHGWDIKYLDGLEELVETITMADVIIVAGRETSHLPEEIQTALTTGLGARRVDGGSLVTLLGKTRFGEQSPSNLHLSLQKLAQENGLKFFHGSFEVPEDFHTYDFNSIEERTNRITPTMDRILHRNVRPADYGINE